MIPSTHKKTLKDVFTFNKFSNSHIEQLSSLIILSKACKDYFFYEIYNAND